VDIVFRGDIGDSQSWGISAIGNITGLQKLGHRISIIPTDSYGEIPQNVRECMWKQLFDPHVFIRQGLADHMAYDLVFTSMVNSRILKIALCCWDSNRLNETGVNVLNNVADKVFCLSNFTKQAFIDSGVKRPVYVCGQGYDPQLFSWKDRPLSRDPYTFLFVGVAQGRKGTQELISGFEKALGDNPHAQLIIKSNSWGVVKDYTVKCSNVKLIHEEASRFDIATYYYGADCFIAPCKGESFYICGLEAMATGLPLIITNWGGPTAYLNEKTGYGIDYDLFDCGYLPGQQAQPRIDSIAEKVLHVFNHREEAKEKGRHGAMWAKEFWTWDKDAERITEAIVA